MHDNNRKWLDNLKDDYSNNFIGAKVLEIGSKDWNGSVRAWCNKSNYYGIDIQEGRFVDEVVTAKDFNSSGDFDTVFSFSVLEHDFEWKQSLANIANCLKRGGMLFMCWGAEGNVEHNPPWEFVPHQEVLGYLRETNFVVVDNFFDEDRYGVNCAGCYNVIARKK